MSYSMCYTYATAVTQSTPQAEAEYSLFGGGVKGKFVSLSAPKEFVQTWALSSPTWPTGVLRLCLPRMLLLTPAFRSSCYSDYDPRPR